MAPLGPTILYLSKFYKLVFLKCSLFAQFRECEFWFRYVSFLGHIIFSEGIHADPKKTEIVQNLPRPLLPSDIQIFLGLAGYYRRFVKGFSPIALPLNTLTLKKVKFLWLEACERSFQELKTRFTSHDFDIAERFRWVCCIL